MTNIMLENLRDDPGRQVEARSRLRSTIDEKPTTLAYMKWSKNLPESSSTRNVAIVSSFTIETLTPYFAVESYLAGIAASPQFVQYGLWENALRDPRFFQSAPPQAAVLLLHEGALGTVGEAAAATVRARVVEAIDAFRSHSNMPLFISVMRPPENANALWKGLGAQPTADLLEEIGGAVSDVVDRYNDIYRLEFTEWMTASSGDWFDRAGALTNLSIVSPKAMPGLARGISRALACYFKPRRKVLVVDFDNTLWGGIVGEDGPENLKLGESWPGSAFVSFQYFLATLRQTGVLLAANSKNNEADAKEVFECRSEMLLDWDAFSASRINWQNKADNIIEIAKELDLGLESLVFADDNPMECALVRELLPDVEVVELGTDPSQFAERILRTGAFDTLSISREDQIRAESYLAERDRRLSSKTATSLSEFFASLDLRLSIQPVDSRNVERIHQLINKTNQFNFTLERLDLEHVRSAIDGAETIYCADLKDKFGEYGIIAMMHLEECDDTLRIRNLVMSCRALGREVENALLAFCGDRAKQSKAKFLEASFIEGSRNSQVEEFFRNGPFTLQAVTSGEKRFVLDLDQQSLPWPQYINVCLAK
jgi:FkbH-like protein